MKHRDEAVPLAQSSEGMEDPNRARIDQVLKMAMSRSQDGEVKTKTHKKKKKQDRPDEVLENIKKGIGVRKDEEDEAMLANTYDPDDIKGEKSNKRRERERKLKQREGIDNTGYEKDPAVPEKEPRKKKKGKKPVQDVEAPERELPSPEPVATPEAEIIEEQDTEKPKKKKKKKKTSPVQEDQELVPGLTGSQENLMKELEAHHDAPAAEPVEDPDKPTVKKRKKKKKKLPEETEVQIDARPDMEAGAEGGVEDEEATAADEPLRDDGRVAGVTVHRTDKLKTDFFVSHPMVRVTVIDEDTGQYLKKLNKGKAVSAYYEKENVDYMLPIMTQPFDFKQKKSTLPIWEELLLFNENFYYFTQPDSKAIIFFELVDFVSMNRAGIQYNRAQQEGGWHHIAWAFLKLVGSTGNPNTDKKVRLQLFQPPTRLRTKPDHPMIYQWFNSRQRLPYPSTLYVTVKGIIPPQTVQPGIRSMNALQEEKGRATFDDLQKTSDHMGLLTGTTNVNKKTPAAWNRLPGQVCKIPNCLVLSLPAGHKGCFVLKFSPDGKSLACGCHDKDGYPIIIYEIPSGRMKGRLLGHYGIIYDVHWSNDSKRLVSACSDGTARVWNMETLSSTPDKLMPHPSFVYTAKFHGRISKVVATAGYDHIIRVWSLQGDSDHAQLMQELDGHMSYINSLCFDEEGGKMASADSLGVIRIWNVHVTDQPSKRGILRDWTLFKELRDEEIKGAAINCVLFHPSGRRLLVHCRDNILRTIDLRVLTVCQRYIGALNFREQIRSTLTPCGTFVMAGSEDGVAYVWHFETGDQVARYSELNFRHPLTDVDFHPHDHMVAFSAFGESEPVLVFRYNYKIAQENAGIGSMAFRSGPAGSPEVNLDAMKLDEPQELGDIDTSAVDFRAQASARLERVKRKLESVTAFQSLPLAANEHPLGVPSRSTSPYPPQSMMSTWGSTFDGTSLMAQGMMSPHSGRQVPISVQQQQMAAQQQYMKQTTSGWRPGFMSVGRKGAPVPGQARPPELSLTLEGKPQFTIQSTSTKDVRSSKTVVALYDYSAQRSDEISLVRGDQVQVIYKDNENWWVGRLPDGQEGFFPANYVADSEEAAQLDEHQMAPPDEVYDEPDAGRQPTVTAVKTKSGDLKFISGAEESDADTPGRRKVKKKRRPVDATTDPDSTRQRPPRKSRQPRDVPESTA